MLQAATLSNCSKVYDWERYYINEEAITEQLATLEERYTPEFIKRIADMLRIELEERPDFVTFGEVVEQVEPEPSVLEGGEEVFEDEEQVEGGKAGGEEQDEVQGGRPDDGEEEEDEVVVKKKGKRRKEKDV